MIGQLSETRIVIVGVVHRGAVRIGLLRQPIQLVVGVAFVKRHQENQATNGAQERASENRPHPFANGAKEWATQNRFGTQGCATRRFPARGVRRTADRTASPIRPEPVTEFVDVQLGEPLRVHFAIPAHLAKDLIATKPTLG